MAANVRGTVTSAAVTSQPGAPVVGGQAPRRAPAGCERNTSLRVWSEHRTGPGRWGGWADPGRRASGARGGTPTGPRAVCEVPDVWEKPTPNQGEMVSTRNQRP